MIHSNYFSISDWGIIPMPVSSLVIFVIDLKLRKKKNYDNVERS